MLAFPGMLVPHCKEAGIKVPENPDGEWDPEAFPHFHVFCAVQLGRAMFWSEPPGNAKVIAELTEDECKTITWEQLFARGFVAKDMGPG